MYHATCMQFCWSSWTNTWWAGWSRPATTSTTSSSDSGRDQMKNETRISLTTQTTERALHVYYTLRGENKVVKKRVMGNFRAMGDYDWPDFTFLCVGGRLGGQIFFLWWRIPLGVRVVGHQWILLTEFIFLIFQRLRTRSTTGPAFKVSFYGLFLLLAHANNTKSLSN